MVKMVSFLLTSESSLRSSLWIGASALVVVTVTPRLVRRYMDCLITSKKREGVFFFATSFVPTILLLHWQKVAWHTNLLVSACLTLFAWVVSSRPTKADKETVDPPMGPHLPPRPLEDLSLVTEEAPLGESPVMTENAADDTKYWMVQSSSKENQRIYKNLYQVLQSQTQRVLSLLNPKNGEGLRGEIYFGFQEGRVVVQGQQSGKVRLFFSIHEDGGTSSHKKELVKAKEAKRQRIIEINRIYLQSQYQFWYLFYNSLIRDGCCGIENPIGKGDLLTMWSEAKDGTEGYFGIEDEKIVFQIGRAGVPETGFWITEDGRQIPNFKLDGYLKRDWEQK